MKNKEKFLTLVSGEKTNSLEINRDRIKNRAMLRESQQIAMKVLDKLDELGWSQKKLADEMLVSPQYISKILKGKENLTIETQIALQQVLDIPILASYYDNKNSMGRRGGVVVYAYDHMQNIDEAGGQTVSHYGLAKSFAMKYHALGGSYSYEKVA